VDLGGVFLRWARRHGLIGVGIRIEHCKSKPISLVPELERPAFTSCSKDLFVLCFIIARFLAYKGAGTWKNVNIIDAIFDGSTPTMEGILWHAYQL
jgi:hypothetical protein